MVDKDYTGAPVNPATTMGRTPGKLHFGGIDVPWQRKWKCPECGKEKTGAEGKCECGAEMERIG